MTWFRKNLKQSTWLALFALALQFLLSFAHFHVDDAQAAPSSQVLADIAHIADDAADIAHERPQPASHNEKQPSSEPCATCAVMSVASQILLATPAALQTPDAIELRLPPAGAELAY
ncbi:DUF2946 family protein, partial [Bradyrhizobium sp.]|uniref:DUF2946 family protein n=1 Tax=Bradyrhizobium sp. TaxID=376 RepID=UPI004037CE05